MLKKVSESVTPINLGTPSSPVQQPVGQPKLSPEVSAIKSKVERAVSESGDLISALECVGAMYGIPATNIIADDTISGIRVVNDNIIAPPLVKANGNTKPIMCAIGSVLDYISQRIDDKLNNYQMDNIIQGRKEDIIDPSPNPKSTSLTYFNEDEDNITNDVDMSAGSSDTATDASDIETNDIADNIQESAYHVKMVSKYKDTTHLGYDMLKKHGFDYIKPIDSFIMESEDSSNNEIQLSDIKHLKFDNTYIIKAIAYFNAARAEQSNVRNGKMDLDKFINSPNYEKGITCLNKQFDCRINLHMFTTEKGVFENAGTSIYNDLKKNLTVSKSKGFQLGGLPIQVEVYNHYFENDSPKDIKLFGQTMVSTICHEIFHNIAYVMRKENVKVGMSLAMTLNVAAHTPSMKDRRIIITNYVNAISGMNGNDLITTINKKKLIKQLTTLATVQNNTPLISDMRKTIGKNPKDADKYIDTLIIRYKKAIKKEKQSTVRKHIYPAIASGISLLAGVCITGPSNAVLKKTLFALGIAGGLGTLFSATGDAITKATAKKAYNETQMFEEYYCDLFAAMYKLPKFFFVGASRFKYVSNDFKDEKVAELAKLEKEFHQIMYDSYPTDIERTHAGVKIAKKLLNEKDLDPSIKNYCEWIVENFSNVNKANIEEIYNKTTFDPKEADDLDKHLQNLIVDNNIVLTESFKTWLLDNSIFSD